MLVVSDARKMNGMKNNKISIQLEKAEATKLDSKKLTKQLNNIGLHCDETRGEKLKKNIEEVAEKIGIGSLTTFGVYMDCGELKVESIPQDKLVKIRKNHIGTLHELLGERYVKEADGMWAEGKTGQFTAKLMVLQNRENFNYLKEKVDDFPYAEVPDKIIKEQISTVDAIKTMFTEAAIACTEATVDGIDETTLEAVFSNAMTAINESVFSEDYNAKNNRVITLLLNYNPETAECDGIGVVTCEWHMQIRNYKDKKNNPYHETIIEINSRSLLYTDAAVLDKHYAMALGRNKELNCLCGDSIKIISEVEVFDRRPPADINTFIKSLPCENDANHADVMVFYSADVQKVGFIDNTQSEAETEYSKSITSGFMTESAVALSTEINFEMDAQVVKAGVKFGFNTSLTNQWSKSQTETIIIRVPARKKAFLYQVTLLCAKLRLDNRTGKYSYIEYGKFLTDAYKTTNEPLYENQIK